VVPERAVVSEAPCNASICYHSYHSLDTLIFVNVWPKGSVCMPPIIIIGNYEEKIIMSKSNPFGAPKITGTVSWEEAYTKYIMYDGELDGFMPASQYDQRRSDPAMLLDMAENPGAYGDMDVLPSRIIDVIFDLIRRINRLGSESVSTSRNPTRSTPYATSSEGPYAT